MMKRSIFLAAICIPSFIHAMEPAEYAIPENLITHRKAVHALHKATYLMLADFNPETKKSTKELATVLAQMNSLKLAQPPIKEKEIGFYILKKNPTVSFAESLKTPFSFTPHPEVTSIIFKRIADYNSDIGKKALVAPNEIQACNHLRAQKIARTVEKAAECNIIISPQAIAESIIPAPGSVGVVEFAQLMEDIAKILGYTEKERKRLVQAAYHHELNGRVGPVSE